MASGNRAPDLLAGLFSRRLLLVSGKGGVGKSSVAAALASLAAQRGQKTLLLSTDGRGDACSLFGAADPGYVEKPLEERLWGLTAEFDPLLADFVRVSVPLSILQNRILASATFRYFTRAAPGLQDLLLLGKVRHLLQRTRERGKAPRYDLVVVDAPATGHALSLFTIPRTLLATVPAGPLRRVAVDLDAWLADPATAALVLVCEPADFAAREAEEMAAGALSRAGLSTSLLVVNRVGRSGRAEALPRLSLPVVRVPEIPVRGPAGDEGFGAEVAFFWEFRALLSGERRAPLPRREQGAEGTAESTLDLAPLLLRSRLVVLLGPGGVGKTTLSAACGIAAARAGRRVLVLTVDPARRLAQALGIDSRADRPVAVPVEGAAPGGTLRAVQIDPKATFERLLDRVASPEAVRSIRTNRLYAGLVDTLPGVLEYMGVEALNEHARDPGIDLIVLDTPPAARGLDFLDSPRRMVSLLENDALRWFLREDSILVRALSGSVRGAAALLRLADRILGLGFLGDMADFFRVFEGLYAGFEARSREIQKELADARFLLATSPDRSALRSAASLASALAGQGHAVGLLVNRVDPAGLPLAGLPPPLRKLPRRLLGESEAPLDELPGDLARSLSAPMPVGARR